MLTERWWDRCVRSLAMKLTNVKNTRWRILAICFVFAFLVYIAYFAGLLIGYQDGSTLNCAPF